MFAWRRVRLVEQSYANSIFAIPNINATKQVAFADTSACYSYIVLSKVVATLITCRLRPSHRDTMEDSVLGKRKRVNKHP